MRKYLTAALAALATLLCCCPSFGWSKTGHRAIVALAERNISAKTKANLWKIMPYNIREDASWMDRHRNDEEYSFTGSYHCMGMNHDFIYEPSRRMAMGGDCVIGLGFVDYMLTHRGQLHLSDSVLVFQVRMLIHIVGDMHTLCHAYVYPERNQWKCRYRGTDYKYHGFMDHINEMVYPDLSAEETAEVIDTWSRRERKKCCKGSFLDWAQECCTRDRIIYDVNPFGTFDLDPDTVEKVSPAVTEALQSAGYRLAFLLDKYFGK